MWLRFSLFDVRVVAHYLGVLVSFFTIALAVPLVVAIAMQEWEPASRYLLAVGISLIVGSGLRLLCVQPGKLTHQQALAVTGLSWIVLAFVASVPLALSGHYGSYLDSLMEAVSGLTTTGVTLVIDLEHLSTADNMWRFVMHLIGGLGLIVVALSLGLLGKATSGLYSSEGRSEHVLPNIVNTVRLISRISLTAIAVAAVPVRDVRSFRHGAGACFLPFLVDIDFWLHYRWLCSYQPVHRVLPFVCAGNRLYGAYAFGCH